MNIPNDLKYTKEHEWVKVDGKVVTVGVTDYAQEHLGDVVYVELPTLGERVKKDDAFGVLESVKAVSDCYAPVTGKILEVNDFLSEAPETINEDCYSEGWMARIEIEDPAELTTLMDHLAYQAFIAEESQ